LACSKNADKLKTLIKSYFLMPNKVKFCILSIFIILTMLASSKIIINNNFLEIKNNKHESFYRYYKNLKKHYNLQIDNINNPNICDDIKNRKIDRHHLRLFFEGFRINFLDTIYKITKSKRVLNYSFTMLIFLTIFLTFLMTFFAGKSILKKKNTESSTSNLLIIFIFFIFFLSIFSFREVSELRFSIFEMLFLSFSMFFAIKKKFFPYLFFCIISVLNRESGIISSLLWFIFNGTYFKNSLFSVNFNLKHLLRSVMVFLISLFIFIIYNKAIFSCGFIPELFVHKDVQNTRVFESNLLSFENLNSFFVNFIFIFFITYFFWTGQNRQIQVFYIILIFNVIFIIFTPLNHTILRIVLLPLVTLYFLYFIEFNKEGKKLTKY